MKKITISDVVSANRAITELYSNDLKYPVNIGFEIHCMKKSLDEIESYAIDRLFRVVDKERYFNGELNEQENLLVDSVMSSEVGINPFRISREDLFKNGEVALSLENISLIDKLFADEGLKS